jgi:hypothetical protein
MYSQCLVADIRNNFVSAAQSLWGWRGTSIANDPELLSWSNDQEIKVVVLVTDQPTKEGGQLQEDYTVYVST